MRRLMLAAALGGGTMMAGHGTAAAQVALEFPGGGVYVGPNYYYDDDYHDDRYYYGPTYREYRDHRDSRSGHERRRDRTVCGRYSYFDGSNCQPGRRPY